MHSRTWASGKRWSHESGMRPQKSFEDFCTFVSFWRMANNLLLSHSHPTHTPSLSRSRVFLMANMTWWCLLVWKMIEWTEWTCTSRYHCCNHGDDTLPFGGKKVQNWHSDHVSMEDIVRYRSAWLKDHLHFCWRGSNYIGTTCFASATITWLFCLGFFLRHLSFPLLCR